MQRLNFTSRLRASCSIGGFYGGDGDNVKYTMEIRPAFRDLNSQDQDHYMLSTVRGLIWVPTEVPVIDDSEPVGEKEERDYDVPIVKSKTHIPVTAVGADGKKEFCFQKREPQSVKKKPKSDENIKASPFPAGTVPQPRVLGFTSPLNFEYGGTRPVPRASPEPPGPSELNPQLKFSLPIESGPMRGVSDLENLLNFQHEDTRPVLDAQPAPPGPRSAGVVAPTIPSNESPLVWSNLNFDRESTRLRLNATPPSSLALEVESPGDVPAIQPNESPVKSNLNFDREGTRLVPNARPSSLALAVTSQDSQSNENSVISAIEKLMGVFKNLNEAGMTNVIFNDYQLLPVFGEEIKKTNGNLLGENGLMAREYASLFSQPATEFEQLRLLALYAVTGIVLDNMYNETRKESFSYYANLKVFDRVVREMSMRPILPMFTVAQSVTTKKEAIEKYYHMFYNYFAPVSECSNEQRELGKSPKCPEFYACRLKCMCMLTTAWFIDWMSTTVDSFEYQMQLYYYTREISLNVKDDSRETRIKLRDSLMKELPFARLFQLLWMHVLLNAAKFTVSSINMSNDDDYVQFSENLSTPLHICQLMGIKERVWSEMKTPLTIQAREIYKSVVCERPVSLKEHESHIELLLLLVDNHILHGRSDDAYKWNESYDDPNFFTTCFNTETIFRDDRYQVELFKDMILKFFTNSYEYSFEPQTFNETDRKKKEHEIRTLFPKNDIHYEETDENELAFLEKLWREE